MKLKYFMDNDEIEPIATPEELECEDDDIIDVFYVNEAESSSVAYEQEIIIDNDISTGNKRKRDNDDLLQSSTIVDLT